MYMSTLTQIMNESTMAPSPSSSPTVVTSKGSSISPSASWVPIYLITILAIVGVVLYFMPTIMDYLSLPEQIIEEKVKKEVDMRKTPKKKKFDDEFLKVDKQGVLEESGYCYIGTDRNIRSCIQVEQGDKCMSGQIFPRMDICVNPSLRL